MQTHGPMTAVQAVRSRRRIPPDVVHVLRMIG